jgi:hypothetical protein
LSPKPEKRWTKAGTGSQPKIEKLCLRVAALENIVRSYQAVIEGTFSEDSRPGQKPALAV